MASLIRILTTLLIAVGFTAPTMAQSDLGNWPTQRPIKMIAVFPPGGSVDQVVRILAPVLQAELKQNIVVENIGGASGVIGTTAVARAPADGYTFGLVFDTHGVNPSLKDNLQSFVNHEVICSPYFNCESITANRHR